MINRSLTAALLAVAAVGMAPVAMAEAPAAKYSTSETDIGTLLDNATTKAILVKLLPGFADNPQIDMARSMTLKQIQGFAGDALSDEKLAAVDAELAKLPAKK